MVKVLVVDDSSMVLEMVAANLRQHGMEVIEANDGAEAVEKLKSITPDLVVTDVVMPRMNGYELCRWIKNNASTKNLPVIMCTTKSEEFDKYWGMKQGADAYLTKPYHPPELIKTIKQLLSQVK
ncbi:response regulator transcription factor [Pseudanabaena mucicola]|jgi:twitching motility two-component system response regulator PilH|uniref:Response regulator n=1 Tax=Pseudanabaena mucicola FACHB-723 TaxID=2692860 RepID=A0ABR8A013_9CYAN|nr:response regulator [Pseudanabaena mucicola]MBD2189557.1 response regulator [Pseudanabaena mucicola FACHB-723]